MSPLLHFLIATLLIAGLILLRMFTDRYTLRAKIRRGHADNECEQAGCFRGCDLDIAAADPDSVSGQNLSKRSKNHAH